MEAKEREFQAVAEILATLKPGGPPALTFLRRASAGMRRPGALLCLSASFNPLTIAHAALIREGSRLIPSQETLLLLATVNVDKSIAGLPLESRLALLLRFADSRPDVSVAAVGHGRFVDKLEAIRAAYPAGTRVVFLLGVDTLTRLFDARYYGDREKSLSRLFAESECVVANRGVDTPRDVEAFLARPDVSPYAHRIRVIRLPADLARISATEIRRRLARGESIAGLVPTEIQAPLEAWWRDCSPGA